MKVHVIMQRVFLLLHLIAFPILSRAADPLITHTIDRVVTGDVINVDYTGVNSPGPVTFTLEYHNVAGERSFEVYYYDLTGQFGCCVNSDDIAPTPAWLRIQPSSAFYPDPGAQNRTITTSITVDPTQAGPSEALISDTFGQTKAIRLPPTPTTMPTG